MTTELILGIIALLIPLVALAVEVSSRSRARKQELAEKEIEEIRYQHQQGLQATSRLTDWASRAALELAKADHILNAKNEIDGECKISRFETAIAISFLVDEGRWLFPNHHPDKFGKEKHKLNHGFRDNRLDGLVSMYKKLLLDEAIDPAGPRKDFTKKVQDLAIPLSYHVAKIRSP